MIDDDMNSSEQLQSFYTKPITHICDYALLTPTATSMYIEPVYECVYSSATDAQKNKSS